MTTIPKCAVLTCENWADPRWYVNDTNGRGVMICDGHDPSPLPNEVRPADPEPPLVRCEPGPNGPRIIIAFDDEERSVSVARAARLRDALTSAIAEVLAEARRCAEERMAKPTGT